MSKSPSLRRIQADIRELSIDPSDQYHAAPLESDMFVWHFTIRGAPETDFENGIYHGKILLSSEYPFKPPDIMFLTPNGRFETNTKLCLSFSAYHPELWQPAWGIRLILEALISFLPTKGDGAIGALDWTSEERKRLAKKSWEYNSPVYGNCKEFMDKWSERVKQSNSGEKKKSRFQKEIEQLHALQAATEGPDKKKKEEQEAKETGKEEDQQEDSVVQNEEKKEEAMDQKPESSTAAAVQNDSSKATNETTSNDKTMDDTKATNTIENTTEPALMDDVKSNNDDMKKTDETISNDDNEKSNDQENNEDNIKPAQSPTVESSTTSANTNAITENQPQEVIPESPLLSDPVVHAGIVIFSILVYLLVRKLQDVVSDLRDLEAQFHAS